MKKRICTLSLLFLFIACKKEQAIDSAIENPEETITYNLKNGGQVTAFVNKNGEYIVGGDIVLSKEQIAYLEYNKVTNGNSTTPRSTFTNQFSKLWPDGVIHYVINDSNNYGDILNAISHWESNTSIRFVPRTNQVNYVDFAGQPTQGGGDSKLGMVGGRQTIRLVSNAGFATVVHEIGHTVGLMHEQTRSDRDQYININYSNIQSNWTSQYSIYNLGTGFEYGEFDYNSVMIYPSYAGGPGNPAYDGNFTPQMTRKDGTIWYQGLYLSQGDIDGVAFLYSPIKLYDYIESEDVNYMDEYTNRSTRERYIKFYDYETNGVKHFISLPKAIKIKVVYTRREYRNHLISLSEQSYTYTLAAGITSAPMGVETFNEMYDQNMNEMDGSYSIHCQAFRIE